jgi:hypothetical protein
MAPVTFAALVRERQAALLERMARLEALRASGETTGFDPEYDRLCDELRFLLELANARLRSLEGVRDGG